MAKFMRESIDMFKEIKTSASDSHQICFIISDGRFNKQVVKPLVAESEEHNLL